MPRVANPLVFLILLAPFLYGAWQVTLIVLGDSRNNYFANGADTLQELSRRCRQVIWLNPESRDRWREGDAEMAAYLPACHVAEVCNSLTDLERIVSKVLRTAS